MLNKETLSRVAEYTPGAKVSSTVALHAASATSLGAPVEKPDHEPVRGAQSLDGKALEKALGNLTAHVQNLQRSLHFSVDQASGETVVRVIDTETKEVIRQIPSEELLAIAERLRETAGVLLSEQA